MSTLFNFLKTYLTYQDLSNVKNKVMMWERFPNFRGNVQTFSHAWGCISIYENRGIFGVFRVFSIYVICF